MTIAYIAIGSNLANPLLQVHIALNYIDKIPRTKRIATSDFYRTIPYGGHKQPDYLNAVIMLQTELSVEVLFNYIQQIELKQGRLRTKNKWQARNIDLDLLLFGNSTIHTKFLKIPHYDMHNRAFVLIPLIQLSPDLHLPDGRSIIFCMNNLDSTNIQYWNK
ncbi:2-amino-4-hydroxy-6-hydroxymethyldihydropteridine diphosphokinase [Candidatus Ishikawella capsulata]|uniref:2-amino-4-hydroxy-6-hydroxymethyldihydropteridine pyrophosphokinase n=1 Tax=Candidatus Ishikawaella capsulata Mpkobe TaxID=476281 RepID=C5WCL5_9ENTR|nr:2-amino-4-hydroxy-6-hydroxymethyldihydropteridine diphosphokinase [Candidatus Ishikawaella capsulata]BAH83071.1 2-amino-4-hydroxy-6-hydroxymethyldihyropteridine pyrophosphokinase [Candidatus Ishikawaella capsulata Mpkobe]